MFGMKKTSELERLRAVYADQSDGELLRLYEEREELTDAAQKALDDEIKERGLEGATVASPEPAPGADHAEEEEDPPGEVCRSNEIEVFTFRSSDQANNLLRLLDEADIEFRLTEGSYIRWAGLRSTREAGVTVIVPGSRESAAKECLRQVLTTPGFDRDESHEVKFTPPSNLALLLSCERTDALDLVPALSAGGISFYWRDGREDHELGGEDVVAIEVPAAQRERGEEIIQKWMDESQG